MLLFQSDRIRWALTAGVVVLLVLFVLQWGRQPAPAADATLLIRNDAAPSAVASAAVTAVASPAAALAVDVVGAVQQPGVYYLPLGARIVDAVDAAGGLAPDAARDQINLAAALADGAQIRVPHVGDGPQASAAASAAAGELVNINTADLAALDALPGIGPTTAQAIIDQRTSGGAFTTIDDIENVKGIGPSLFAQLKPRITVGP